MRSPREFLSGEFLKVKYTRRLSTEYPPELRQVPGPIESTAHCYLNKLMKQKGSKSHLHYSNILYSTFHYSLVTSHAKII